MSRWLKSVNNLLETLDGKAETVAADGQAIGKLLENGREAVVAAGLGPRRTTSGSSMGSKSSDDDDDDDEDEDGEDNYEEYDDDIETDDEEEDEQQQQKQQQQPQENRHDPRDDAATVSDISASQRTGDDDDDDDDEIYDNDNELGIEQEMPLKPSAETQTSNRTTGSPFGGGDSTGSGDFMPNVPNRQATRPKQIKDMSLSTSNHGESPRRGSSNNNNINNKSKTYVPASSPKVDASPRFPRRSLEGGESSGLPAAGASLLEDENRDNNNDEESGAGGKVDDAAAPPRFPLRKASFPNSTSSQQQQQQQPSTTMADLAPISAVTMATNPSTASNINKNIVAPPSKANKASSSSSIAKAPPSGNPKSTKEYQKLREKLESVQSQLSKAATELKTSQTLIKSLQTQNQTLESKLEAANSEIHAQGDELRRAGERMEKDRLRAHEEREELLDEQDEEMDQLKQAHQKELDGLRSQYEKQIADLTQQLQSEETRRRQEGGDYTQELQDAVERERDALKQLSAVTSEKNQFQSLISKLELQQTALQGKLESALQSVKTATEREREAEDKLDATMSLHSRQLSQRQSREAELEKTIFDLGTALMVARQKQQNLSQMPAMQSTSEKEGESLKDKYIAAAEEVDTLKVQLNMETQRREALQEELNDISRERSEEASSAQARQRLHDRKVSELESTVSRLQAIVRAQKTTIGKHPGNGGAQESNPAILSEELQTARREIESLTTQLLRHQNMSENSKSEILALKGRLQATTSRAEQAEQSLQVAQSTRSSGVMSNNRLYEMEGGGVVGGGMRRRVKGGTTRGRNNRSIRAALQMNPGRTNHPVMEQIAMTLDALDNWMVDTGAFLRHEPLARLAFMLYLVTLHLWSFALVVFHTTEQPHADFGSMDNNPRHWRAAVAAVAQQPQT